MRVTADLVWKKNCDSNTPFLIWRIFMRLKFGRDTIGLVVPSGASKKEHNWLIPEKDAV